MYTIHQKQQIPVSLTEAWAFFSDPANLAAITPDYMGFEIITGGDSTMFPGQVIEYIVTPIAGIETQWVTEITHLIRKEYFVDEQRIGPYKFWHHKHFFKEINGGTEIEDKIHYQLPFGVIGRFAHALIVKRKLDEIFSYRKEKLESIFGKEATEIRKH
ncbi:MAG TPA: SRPBCC family protein [Balneolaceae bacterium]